MDKDFLDIVDDLVRGFQHINVCIERGDDGYYSWKKTDEPDFWETMKEDRPKTSEEKLAEAEFVECEIVEENTVAIGYAAG